jgi:hypothetical protein
MQRGIVFGNKLQAEGKVMDAVKEKALGKLYCEVVLLFRTGLRLS